MALDLFPRPIGPESADLPAGMTHQKSEPCPYENDDNPIGIFGTCCSFQGNATVVFMVSMGMGRLAGDLFSDMNPQEALTFSGMLRSAAASYRQALLHLRLGTEELNVAVFGIRQAEIRNVELSVSVTKALRTIEVTADWYEKTGMMGCGVRARSYG